MALNPYRVADIRGTRVRSQSRVGDWWAFSSFLAACAAVPLLNDSVFAFATSTGPARSAGAVGAVARVALVLAGVLALRAYDLVVRGPDRGVVDVHPVLAGPYVRARLIRTLGESGTALLTAAVVLVPVWPDVRALLGGGVLLLGAWAAGVALGVGVNLAAPGLGANPAFASALDVVRGQNPRSQAALVWAPAVTLAVVGLSIVAAAGGLDVALRGEGWGYLALGVPFAAAGLGVRLAFVGADTLARIPAVLGEVDAAYAAVEEAEEGRRVYLEWIVPRLPVSIQAEVLRVLRHGWRSERAWLSATFLVAVLAAAAGWTPGPDGPSRVLMVGGLAAVGIGLLGPRLRSKDPAWLALTLPSRFPRVAAGVAIFAWIQPVAVSGCAVLLVRHGSSALPTFALLEAWAVLVAVLAARLPVGGYLPASLLLFAAGQLA